MTEQSSVEPAYESLGDPWGLFSFFFGQEFAFGLQLQILKNSGLLGNQCKWK